MADRYWVGGTGTWNSVSTVNWSTATGKSITASCATTTLTVTAGTVVVGDTVWSNNHTSLGTITADLGGGNWTVSIGGTFASQAMSAATVGASVPTAVDSVFFDANSNSGTTAFTVTMATTPRLCNDFTASGLDGVMTLAGASIGLTVSGSLSFPATNFTRTYTGTTTFNATTTGKTITTNGVAFGAAVTLNGAGGAWTLGSAFSCGTSVLTLTAGTFNTSASNYAVTAGTFSSSGTGTRTITLNASTLTFSLTAAWTMTTSTNATLNAGTSTIALSSTGATFAGGGLTYYNVSFTSTTTTTVASAITGANTFNNLTFATFASAGLNNITIGADQTINGILTANGANGGQRQFIRSDVAGTARTLTFANYSTPFTDVDFRDITIAGAGAVIPFSGTRLGNCGGNTNISFSAGTNKYWNLAVGGNWSDTAWALDSGGAVAVGNFPLAQDTVIIDNTGLNSTATITIDAGYNIKTLDISTRTNAMTLASGSTSPVFYGNWISGSGLTNTGTGTYTFSGSTTQTITSAGRTFTQSLQINSIGGTVRLLDACTTSKATAGAVTLTNGTLDLNGYTLTLSTTGTFLTSSGTKNLTFNGGSVVIAASGTTAWNNVSPTGFTTTAGLGGGTISLTSASAKTFVGAGSTYNCTLNQGGAGALTISGSNTFTRISNSVQPTTFIFTAGTNTKVSYWTVAGTAGNLVTLLSSIAGSTYTITPLPTATAQFEFGAANNNDGTFTIDLASLGITNPNTSIFINSIDVRGDLGVSTTEYIDLKLSTASNYNRYTGVADDNIYVNQAWLGPQPSSAGNVFINYIIPIDVNTSPGLPNGYFWQVRLNLLLFNLDLTTLNTVNSDYLTVRDAQGGPVSDILYIGANSNFVAAAGNNPNGVYLTKQSTNRIIVLTSISATTWTVPSDWNNASNTIHLIGGGGGGGGSSQEGGSGGGGGGYTRLINQTLTPGASITYQVGSAGTAGTSVVNGAAGGTTSWNSGAATAGGGGGGITSTTSVAVAGGAGGVGATFNGGGGGIGNEGTNGGGGGGGGAAGPNGAGGAGGAGSTGTGGSNARGGGGGGNGGGTAGAAGISGSGGTGGNNSAGVGGGNGGAIGGISGFAGGGGSGGQGQSIIDGGNGSNGLEIFGVGSGSGSGGSSTDIANNLTSAGLYGGGGGGCGRKASSSGAGGPGAQGAIIIVYTPKKSPNNMTQMFM